MSPSTPTSPSLSIDAVLAFNDNELVKYMRQKRGSDGGFDLDDIVGWADLSADRRSELAQRLRAGAAIIAGDAVQSRPVDLDQVTARLQAISNKEGPDLALCCRSPGDPQRVYNEHGKISETVYYNDLVFENPGEYREILRPLTRYPFSNLGSDDWWWVFIDQWWTWENFRKWRQDLRGTYDAEAEFAIFFRKEKHINIVTGCDWWNKEAEADPSKPREWFAGIEETRRREQFALLEFPGEGLAAYSKAVEQRLAEHGFTQPFRLEEDPRRQDKLTTWIEYLNYEYCRHDKLVKRVEYLQPKREEAWRRLVDSGAVRLGETEEYLRSDASMFQIQDEMDAAHKAWKEAQAAGYGVLEAARRIPDQARRRRMMEAAQVRAERAKARLKAAKSRNSLIFKFIRETEFYTTTTKDVRRSALLLEWVLAQVPLIEAEMKEEAGAGAGAGDAPCSKRGRDQSDDDNFTDKPGLKKQRRNGRRTSSIADGSFSAAAAAEAGEMSKRRWAGEESEPALAEPHVDRPVRSTAVTILQRAEDLETAELRIAKESRECRAQLPSANQVPVASRPTRKRASSDLSDSGPPTKRSRRGKLQ